MARAAGRTTIPLAILGGLLVLRCTGARDPLNSRIEALEKRVAELEQASPAILEPPRDSGISDPDASLESVPSQPTPALPPAWDATVNSSSCADVARFACEHRSPAPLHRAKRQAHDEDAGLAWHHRFRPDSPEGRLCLREERERCESDIRFNREQRELYEQREEQYFRWLDGQISPNRIDAKLSAKIEARTKDALRRAGEAAPTVTVRCVLEFCRVDLDVDPLRPDLRAAGYRGIDWQSNGSTARHDPGNPRRFSIYLARPGWVMPPWPSLMQRGASGRFPPGPFYDAG